MRSNVKLALATGCMVAVVAMAGCTQGGAPAADEQTDLRVLTFNSELMKALIEGFQTAHPEYNVIYDTTTDEELRSGLRLYTSTDAPDVGFMWADARIMPQLLEAEALTEISDVWEEAGLFEAYPESLQQLLTVDDQQFAVSYEQVWAPVVYYNKALFEDAGVVAPSGPVATEAEWDSIVEGLNESGIPALAIGAKEYPAIHLFDQLLQSASTDDEFAGYLDGWRTGDKSVRYDEGPFLDALSVVAEWSEDGVFAPGAAGADYNTASALFTSGQAAMLSNASWGPSLIDTDAPDLDYGWFLYSPVKESSKFLTYTGSAFVIPKTSTNVEGAKAFLEYVMSRDTQKDIVGELSIPVRLDIPAEELTNTNPVVREQFDQFGAVGTAALWGDVVPPELSEATRIQIPNLMTGRATPEEVGKEIQSVYESLIE